MNNKIEESKSQIKELLLQLHPNFVKSPETEGWSFLQACIRKDGVHWTDFHIVVEALVVLGEAAGFISYPFPREVWEALPGGMPYFVVNDE